MLGKNYLNDEVMVMGKVSSLRWSRKASRRRYTLSRGLKTGGVTGDKENMQPHEVGGSPMSPCHSPFALQAAGLAAGVCLVSLVGAS